MSSSNTKKKSFFLDWIIPILAALLNNSDDARYWSNPYIDGKDIEAKAQLTVYPFDRIGFVK